jgi:hypothetical protein
LAYGSSMGVEFQSSSERGSGSEQHRTPADCRWLAIDHQLTLDTASVDEIPIGFAHIGSELPRELCHPFVYSIASSVSCCTTHCVNWSDATHEAMIGVCCKTRTTLAKQRSMTLRLPRSEPQQELVSDFPNYELRVPVTGNKNTTATFALASLDRARGRLQ